MIKTELFKKIYVLELIIYFGRTTSLVHTYFNTLLNYERT